MTTNADVLVTGGSGLIGRAVVASLLARGIKTRSLQRSPMRSPMAHGASPLDSSPLLTCISADLRDTSAVREAMRGVTHVMHLAARKSDEADSEAINVEGTRHLLAAAQAERVSLFLHVSTPSASLASPGVYGRTKAAAETLVRASSVPHVIIRPSVVYGDLSSGILGSMMKFLSLPVVPMIGDGHVTFAPIHRDDLAELLVALLTQPRAMGGTFDAGGPEVLSFRTMLTQCMTAMNVQKRIVSLPVPVALFLARLVAFLPHPPLTVSNVRGAVQDVPLDLAPLRAILPYEARTFRKGVEALMGGKRLSTQNEPEREREARVLLVYVLSGNGCATPPSQDACDRYLRALAVHGIDPAHRLGERFLRSRWQLRGLDALSKWRCPQSTLQRKLLIAAAIAETTPHSAPFLLPQSLSFVALLLALIATGARSFAAFCIGFVIALTVPWKTHAGC